MRFRHLKTLIIYMILGLCASVVGSASNIFVEWANNGYMPVISNEWNPGQIIDGRHICASSASHFLLLADRINIGSLNSICSIGDVFIVLGFAMFVGLPLIGLWVAVEKVIHLCSKEKS